MIDLTAPSGRRYISAVLKSLNSLPSLGIGGAGKETKNRVLPRRVRIIVPALILAAVALPAAAQRTVILVRHAEKVDSSKDAALSETGLARARALAVLLGRAGVTAVYASEYQRTIKTAEPLAAALKLPVQTFPAADAAGLVERLRTRHPDDVVLVVGHSNTLPDLMKRFGHSVAETIDDDDFGSLFILVPRPGQSPAVVRLRY